MPVEKTIWRKNFAAFANYHYYLSMRKILPLLITLLVLSSNTFAKMYKWVDEEGNISYSDAPPFKGAQQLDAPALSTVPTPAASKKKPDTKAEEPEQEETKYTYLKITSPEDNATIRSNEGNFFISISIKPTLDIKRGHYFSVSMDGKIIHKKTQSTSPSFTNIDRGTHTINVKIMNKQAKALKQSAGITVHLHRQSTIRKQAR